MTRHGWSGGFGAGLVGGLLLTLTLFGSRSLLTAQAQEPARRTELPRFQITAWAHGSLNGEDKFGAYIVDTQNGTVWRSEGHGGGIHQVGQCK